MDGKRRFRVIAAVIAEWNKYGGVQLDIIQDWENSPIWSSGLFAKLCSARTPDPTTGAVDVTIINNCQTASCLCALAAGGNRRQRSSPASPVVQRENRHHVVGQAFKAAGAAGSLSASVRPTPPSVVLV